MNSITLKFISIVAAGFILLTLAITFLIYTQLTDVIDQKQRALYREKIDAIYTFLNNSHERLKRTGLEEAYIDDFQRVAIKTIQKNYYRGKALFQYPFILDRQRRVVIHPRGKQGDMIPRTVAVMKRFASKIAGDFTPPGAEQWYIYRVFQPWGWTIGYTIPHGIKYHDAGRILKTLLILIVGLSLLILLVLSFFLVKLIRPIIKLTRVSELIAAGDLDQKIEQQGGDEIGKLSRSFNNMRRSIRQKIIDLEEEIHERTRIQKELKKARNDISSIIDSMPSILIGVDSEGRVTRWNSAIKEITGISADEARGHSVFELFPEIGIEPGVIQQSIKTGEIKKEFSRLRKSGNRLLYEDITIYPLIADGGKGAVIRIDDVTRAYELEHQLLQSQKMDAIGQLAGGVAHDFNNMLTGILGAAEVLKFPEMNLDEEGILFVDTIIDAVNRAGDLTTKLLAFGRKNRVISATIDLRKVIDDAVAILKRTIDKRITIVVRKEGEKHTITGDYTALQNVLINLGINAAHAMPDGGEIQIITGNISLDQIYCDCSTFELTPGNYLKIEVRDSGVGIEPHHLQKIFEPFFTTKAQGKGTGLGLAAVYGTMQNHNGAITVYSELNAGTVFYLYLPISTDTPQEEKTDDQEALVMGSGLILLVDDEAVIRTTGERMLTRMGYEVMVAKNGVDAVALFLEHHQSIRCVVVDMIMPEMNGRETFFKMQEMNKNVPVIIASGFTRDENIAALKKAGLAGFIQKPFQGNQLSALLGRVLNSEKV